MIAFIGLLLGVLLGLIFDINIPEKFSPYMSVAILACLDSAFGAFRATLNKKFKPDIFISGFFGNSLLAAALAYLGDKLGIPTIGLIDSNCNPEDVDYVIPGNDDAVRSVSLIAGKIADAVIEVKEGNLATIEDDEIETMQELVDKEGVDKIERKPKQNNRRNYNRRDNRKEEVAEETTEATETAEEEVKEDKE